MLLQALRAAILDPSVFREIREDPAAIWRSVAVVMSVAIAFGLGFWDQPVQDLQPSFALVLRLGVIFNGWLIWGAIALFIGRRFFRGDATFNQILKGLGLAFAPGLLLVLFPLPIVGETVSIMGRVWILGTGTVATGETMRVGLPGAIFISVIGWLVAFVLLPWFLLPPPQ